MTKISLFARLTVVLQFLARQTGVWKIVAPMLDPVVRAKVHMTKGTEVRPISIFEFAYVSNQRGCHH